MPYKGTRIHVVEFENWIERTASQIIGENYPLTWKEDQITIELVKRIQSDLKEVELVGMRDLIRIEWEAYKLSGKPETAHGDIGVLIQYTLPTGNLLEGAGFLEAKVRSKDSSKFKEIKPAQLTTILSQSPYSKLLLYDYEKFPTLDSLGFTTYSNAHPWYLNDAPALARTSNVGVVPMNVAKRYTSRDTILYRFAFSLSHQLTSRYFQMQDLDFSDTAINAVKGFPGTQGGPRVVLVIKICPPGKEFSKESGPHHETYQRIEN